MEPAESAELAWTIITAIGITFSTLTLLQYTAVLRNQIKSFSASPTTTKLIVYYRNDILRSLYYGRMMEATRFGAYILLFFVGLRTLTGFAPDLPTSIFTWDPVSVWATITGMSVIVLNTGISYWQIRKQYYKTLHGH